MFGNVTTLGGLHVTGKYRDRRMQRTCFRHAAWDPHSWGLWTASYGLRFRSMVEGLRCRVLGPRG